MGTYWGKIKKRLSDLGCLDEAKINPGAAESEIKDLEAHIGVLLPEDLKQFLIIHNGQKDDGVGIVFGEQILSIESIRRCWNDWRDIDEEEMNEDCADLMGSSPEGYIKPMYTNKNWIPLTHDWGGNHIGIDYVPDVKGQQGQIIAFGRDEDIKRLVAVNFTEFLDKLLISLEKAQWTGEYLDGQLA